MSDDDREAEIRAAIAAEFADVPNLTRMRFLLARLDAARAERKKMIAACAGLTASIVKNSPPVLARTILAFAGQATDEFRDRESDRDQLIAVARAADDVCAHEYSETDPTRHCLDCGTCRLKAAISSLPEELRAEVEGG